LKAFDQSAWFTRLPYDATVTGQILQKRYNRFQAVLNPPSVYSGHTCRVWEALACGCLLFTPTPQTTKEADLFTSGQHLIYYHRTEPAAVMGQMEAYLRDPARQVEAEGIARRGAELIRQKHTLSARLQEIIEAL
jgi:spore maturation protein CgeB